MTASIAFFPLCSRGWNSSFQVQGSDEIHAGEIWGSKKYSGSTDIPRVNIFVALQWLRYSEGFDREITDPETEKMQTFSNTGRDISIIYALIGITWILKVFMKSWLGIYKLFVQRSLINLVMRSWQELIYVIKILYMFYHVQISG